MPPLPRTREYVDPTGSRDDQMYVVRVAQSNSVELAPDVVVISSTGCMSIVDIPKVRDLRALIGQGVCC